MKQPNKYKHPDTGRFAAKRFYGGGPTIMTHFPRYPAELRAALARLASTARTLHEYERGRAEAFARHPEIIRTHDTHTTDLTRRRR